MQSQSGNPLPWGSTPGGMTQFGTDVVRAAGILRAGGLVGMPTETVYGLAANALDACAVAKVFAAKGRPTFDPLIVHLADVSELPAVVSGCPATGVATGGVMLAGAIDTGAAEGCKCAGPGDFRVTRCGRSHSCSCHGSAVTA